MTPTRKRRAWTIRRHPATWLLALLVPAFVSIGSTANATTTTIEPAAEAPVAEKAGDGKKKKKGKKKKGKKKKGKKKKGETTATADAKVDPEPTPEDGAQTDPSPPPPPPPASDEPALLEVPKSTTPPTFEVLPLKVRGKLSKSGRNKLLAPLKTAAESASAPDGPYRLRLTVNTKRKRSYTLTLKVLPAKGGDPLHTFTESCKSCTLADATGLVDPLFEQALGALAPEEPSLPSPGSLTIRSVPLGAKITIDGVERGITPLTLELPPGEHTIVVLKPGFAEHRETLAIESDTEQQIEPTLGAASDAPTKGGPKAGRPWTIAGAVILSLGVAGVGTGVAMILVDEDPMPFKCPDAELDFQGTCRYRYNTFMGGIIGVAAGGLGVAGGIALLIKGRIVTVRARGGKDQASLGLMMRW